MTEEQEQPQQPKQSKSARAREYYAKEREREREEMKARREQDREIGRQRQVGVARLAFKAGFYGTLGAALASLIIGVIVAIFWLMVFGALFNAFSS